MTYYTVLGSSWIFHETPQGVYRKSYHGGWQSVSIFQTPYEEYKLRVTNLYVILVSGRL